MNETPAPTRFRSLLARGTRSGRLGSWRVRRVLAVFVVGAIVFAIWRAYSLTGLPDVGAPFDVAEAIKPIAIPDSENAFVVYAKAHARLGRPAAAIRQSEAWKKGDWSRSDSALRTYLAANRPALDVWREGSERPKAIYHQIDNARIETVVPLVTNLGEFTQMALLEAGRLEAAGDVDGAWGWYRAILRSSRHTSHGFLIQRLVGGALYRRASERVTRWAADPAGDATHLRQALEEVLAINAMTPPPFAKGLSGRNTLITETRDFDEMRYLRRCRFPHRSSREPGSPRPAVNQSRCECVPAHPGGAAQ